MLLTAIKEMRSGKGASTNGIFTYVRSTYGYDLLKNRNHIRRALVKLIDEGLVDRVKGRGLAGSFRLGKKYKVFETFEIFLSSSGQKILFDGPVSGRTKIDKRYTHLF